MRLSAATEQVEDKGVVLVVDDDPVSVGVLFEHLRRANFTVRISEDGMSALKSIERARPDIILLDIMLPDMGGFEVCKILKRKPKAKDIPVIFLSALTDTSEKIKGLDLDAVDYITKPFQAEEVIARIERHLTIRNLQKRLLENNIQLQVEIAERRRVEEELHETAAKLETANRFLDDRIKEEVSKCRRQQELLIQRSKLESLGKLAAGIAHEINQPLAGISMGLDNILVKITSGTVGKPYLNAKINTLLEHVDRIKHIIDHIRAFSREQTSDAVERIDVSEVCDNALSIMGEQYRKHGIAVELRCDDSVDPVLGNKYKLEQVALNLISNAKDAVDEKGRQAGNENYVKRIRIRVFQQDRRVRLDIEDNGVGIPDAHLRNIFDPFFTTKSANEGTGLGLSVSYGIVKEMNGTITVETRPGEFTRMQVSLPAVGD